MSPKVFFPPKVLGQLFKRRSPFIPSWKPFTGKTPFFLAFVVLAVVVSVSLAHPLGSFSRVLGASGQPAPQDNAPPADNETASIAASQISADSVPTPQPTPTETVAITPSPAPTAQQVAEAPAGAPSNAARTEPRAVVVIDPGHGGSDIGANRTFPDGFVMKEADLTLKISLKIADKLRNQGFKAILTRESDVPVNYPPVNRTGYSSIGTADELQARVDIANNAKADLFVSVHLNAAANPQGGTEVFYCADRPFSDKSKKMAAFLQDDLLKGIHSLGYDSPNRGVKMDTQSAAGTYLYVLGPKTNIIAKPIAMPSVLGEALFITNPSEGNLLRSDKTLDTIADAYTQAVDQYFDWLKNL